MHNSAKFAAVLATAALAYVPAPAAAQSCEDLVLGAALSATGIYAANGNNTKNGYEFAVKKINDAGGIKIGGKCYHLKVKYYDDKSTPARAAQLVERLIDQDKVKFMLGPYGSPLTKAICRSSRNTRCRWCRAKPLPARSSRKATNINFGIVATSEKYLTPRHRHGGRTRQEGRQEPVVASKSR